MGSLWKHIHPLDDIQLVAQLNEALKVAGEGVGVTGDVVDLFRAAFCHGFDYLKGAAFAGGIQDHRSRFQAA